MRVPLEELDQRLRLPRTVRLSRETWLAAGVLGRLRTLVNDTNRGPTRDRGPEKNLRADLRGALGELVGLALLDRLLRSLNLAPQW